MPCPTLYAMATLLYSFIFLFINMALKYIDSRKVSINYTSSGAPKSFYITLPKDLILYILSKLSVSLDDVTLGSKDLIFEVYFEEKSNKIILKPKVAEKVRTK